MIAFIITLCLLLICAMVLISVLLDEAGRLRELSRGRK